jgi:hypothetical protein
MVVTAAARKRCAGNWRSANTSQENGYKINTLVAFSGEVIDLDSGP